MSATNKSARNAAHAVTDLTLAEWRWISERKSVLFAPVPR